MEINTKVMVPDVATAETTCRRLACENAWKHNHFLSFPEKYISVSEHYFWYFGISLMFFRWFFRFWMSFNAFGRIWRRFEASFEVFSDGVCNFYRSNFTIFRWNPRFRAFFLGSSTGFFEKYAAFEALLKYLFVFFRVFQVLITFRSITYDSPRRRGGSSAARPCARAMLPARAQVLAYFLITKNQHAGM